MKDIRIKEKVIYWAVCILTRGSSDREIKHKMALASAAMVKLTKIWKDRSNWKLDSKLRILIN